MNSTLVVLLLLLIAPHSSFSTLTEERLETVRVQIVALSQTLQNGRKPDQHAVSTLSKSLSVILKTSVDEFPQKAKADGKISRRLNGLDSLMERFEKLYSTPLGVDTLRSAIKDLRQSFMNAFAEHFYATGMISKTKKVILFSTSVSCECTLKMCEEQELALYSLQSSNHSRLTVIVVDAFHHYNLQKKHGVAFLPTVIVLDEVNKELTRMERGEQITEKIRSVIN